MKKELPQSKRPTDLNARTGPACVPECGVGRHTRRGGSGRPLTVDELQLLSRWTRGTDPGINLLSHDDTPRGSIRRRYEVPSLRLLFGQNLSQRREPK